MELPKVVFHGTSKYDQFGYFINEVQTLSTVALHAIAPCTDNASIAGLSPLNWAVVYCPALSCMLLGSMHVLYNSPLGSSRMRNYTDEAPCSACATRKQT